MSYKVVDLVLRNENLKAPAKTVLVALASYCGTDEGNRCFASLSSLALRAGVSRSVVFESIERLVDAKLVRLEKGVGRTHSNSYVLNLAKIAKCTDSLKRSKGRKQSAGQTISKGLPPGLFSDKRSAPRQKRSAPRTSKGLPPGPETGIESVLKAGHEQLGSSSLPHAPLPGFESNGDGWGKRDWIPFFLRNQNDVPDLPIDYFLEPEWWNALFKRYPGQIGPGTLERTFAFMAQHFIESPQKRPKTKRSYLQKIRNLVRVQLDMDERACNGGGDYRGLIGPQSEWMRDYLERRKTTP